MCRMWFSELLYCTTLTVSNTRISSSEFRAKWCVGNEWVHEVGLPEIERSWKSNISNSFPKNLLKATKNICSVTSKATLNNYLIKVLFQNELKPTDISPIFIFSKILGLRITGQCFV